MKTSQHPNKGLREKVAELMDEVSELRAEIRALSIRIKVAESNDEVTSRAMLIVMRQQQEILKSINEAIGKSAKPTE